MKRLMMILFAVAFTSGMAFAQSNTAYVDQQEDGNEAFIDQVGDQHDATIEQLGEEGIAVGEGHYALIDQRGLEGTGSGENNTATVKQDLGWATASHTANIYQWGNDNNVDVEQTAPGFNLANITQDGIGNYAGLYQQYWNTFEATQEGDGNRIEGVLGSTYGTEEVAFQISDGWSSLRYEMYLTQDGDDNTIQAGQERGSGISTVTQNGDWNTALSYQNNGNGDVINITQNGNQNDAVVSQTQ